MCAAYTLPLPAVSSPQAVEEALTRILTPKRSIDVLREVKAAQVGWLRDSSWALDASLVSVG